MATSQVATPGTAEAWSFRVRTPWWLVLIAGIALVIVGLLTLMSPATSLVVLVQFLGVYWLVDGVIRLASIFFDRSGWGWNLISGVLGIVIGICVLAYPLQSAIVVPATFALLLGVTVMVLGGIEVVSAFMGAGWGTGILGAVSLLVGGIVAFNPLVGVVALPLMFGLVAIAGGVVAIGLAFKAWSDRAAHPA